jgi:DHA2 family multidrug resistance protein
MAETGFKRWIVVITVITATIIELIDTSIVNVALTEMSGNLGATLEDISWVVTAYAIANVIIIPMTGFLASLFGRKRYYVGSIILFTVASVFCGTSRNLWELVLFRFLQGIGGGALLSTSQAILFEAFSEQERGTAGGIFSLGVILGPTIGPTLGGWIVDNYSWPWIFYVNLPIGIAATLLTLSFVHDPPHARRRSVHIDWTGISLLAVGLASLQYVLERGESEDWFDAPHIVVLTGVTVFSLVGFVWWELKTPVPVVNLRVLKSRTLAIAAGLTFMIGFGLFGSTYVVPVFAQRILGMTALDTGLLMMPGALAAMVVAPISGRLVQRGFPAQLLVFGGFSIFAFFCFRMSHLSTDMGREHFFWPLIVRGVGIASLSVPLTTLAVSGLQGRDLAQGAALNNMMRQLGGSFGIALINTYVANRAFINRNHLAATINVFEFETQSRFAALSAAFEQAGASVVEAQQRALTVLNGILTQQSAVISYGDTFRILALFFLGCMLAIPFLRRPRGAPVVTISEH